MAKTNKIETPLHDDEDYVFASVSRNRTACGLDYIAIKNHDDLICVPLDRVPEFLRAVMKAAARD